MELPPYAVIVLAGGRGTRLGGVHKPDVAIAGRTLLDRVLAALPERTATVVVGPGPAPDGALLTREEPAGGGPVAALAAGLAALPGAPEFAAVMAADLPFLTPAAVSALRAAAADGDAAILADSSGRDQYLAGVWRVPALARALAAIGEHAGAPMRRLVSALVVTRVSLPREPETPAPWFDCDDPDDLIEAERWAHRHERHERP